MKFAQVAAPLFALPMALGFTTTPSFRHAFSSSPSSLTTTSREIQAVSPVTFRGVTLSAVAGDDNDQERAEPEKEPLAVDVVTSKDDDEDDDEEPVEPDPNVLDAMYRVAEFMSEPPNKGGVTFLAFKTVPPIALLSGTGEDDLTKAELTDCWQKGSLGATRVDRAGFERVWRQVQDNYYSDIVEEARERTLVRKKQKRGTDKTKASVVSAQTPAQPVPATTRTPAPTTEEITAKIKDIKDDDIDAMLELFSKMGPAEEARFKAMGMDPEVLKKSASVMKSNPLMRKAATTMIKNTSPEQILKAGKETQERFANMSEDDKKRMMQELENEAK